MSATSADFELFRVLLGKTCGVVLGSNKQYLVSSWLNRLTEQQGIENLGKLVQRIRTQRGGLRGMVVGAMTTSEILWSHDTCPFEVLKQRVLPELIKASDGQRLRIWSAACSPGQEPYLLSMAIGEFEKTNLGQLKAGMQIVVIDLLESMPTAAKAGEYDTLATGCGLSPKRLRRYFDAKGPGRWTIKPAIRSRVEFRTLSLLDSHASLGKFDMVFCRNVLIYFFTEVKCDILLCIHGTLKPGGYLSLGASEALNNLPNYYRMVQCNPGITYWAKQRKEVDSRQTTPEVTQQPGAGPFGTGRWDETFALYPGSERHARQRRRNPFDIGRLVRGGVVQSYAIQLH